MFARMCLSSLKFFDRHRVITRDENRSTDTLCFRGREILTTMRKIRDKTAHFIYRIWPWALVAVAIVVTAVWILSLRYGLVRLIEWQSKRFQQSVGCSRGDG